MNEKKEDDPFPSSVETRDGQGRSNELHLYASGLSSIYDIPGLETKSNLRDLNLHFNQIRKIANLETLTNLVSLNLSSNEIEAIEGLGSLKNLKELDLSCNKITSVQGLEGALNLEKISLAYNLIHDLRGFDSNVFQREAQKLQNIDLRDNRISELDQLRFLQGCKALRVLRLEAEPNFTNPICENRQYYAQIRSILPSVRMLDGYTVEEYVHRRKPLKTQREQGLRDKYSQGFPTLVQGYPSRTLKPQPMSTDTVEDPLRIGNNPWVSQTPSAIDRALQGYYRRRQQHSSSDTKFDRGSRAGSRSRNSDEKDSGKYHQDGKNQDPSEPPPRNSKQIIIAKEEGHEGNESKASMDEGETVKLVEDLRKMMENVSSLTSELKSEREIAKTKSQTKNQEHMENELKRVSEQLLQMQKQLEQEKHIADRKTEKMKEMTERFQQSESRRDTLEKGLQEEIHQLRQDIAFERKSKSHLDVENARLKEKLHNYESENTSLKADVQRLSGKLEATEAIREEVEKKAELLIQSEKTMREQLVQSSELSICQAQKLVERSVRSEEEASDWKRKFKKLELELKQADRRQAELMVKFDAEKDISTASMQQLNQKIVNQAQIINRLEKEVKKESLLASDANKTLKDFRDRFHKLQDVNRRERDSHKQSTLENSKAHDRKVKTLQKAYKSAMCDLNDLKEILRLRLANEKKTHALVNQLKEVVSEQRKKLEEVHKDKSELEEARRKSKTQLKELGKLKERITRLERENADLEHEIDTKHKDTSEIEAKLSQLEALNDGSKIQELEDKLRVKNRMLDDQNDSISSLKRTKERLERELNEAEKREDELTEQVEDLDLQKRKLEKEVDEVRDKLDSYQSEVHKANHILSEEKSQISSLTESIRKKDDKIKTLHESLEKKEKMVEFIEREVRKIKSAQKDSESRLAVKHADLKTKQETMKKELEASQLQLRTSNRLLKLAHEECKKLQKQNHGMSAKVNQTENEMRSLLKELQQHKKRTMHLARSLLSIGPSVNSGGANI